MSAAALIIIRRNRVLRRFRELGALAPERAVAWQAIGVRRGLVTRSLISHGVLVDAGADRWWLDEARADDWLSSRNRRLLVALVVIVVIVSSIFAVASLL